MLRRQVEVGAFMLALVAALFVATMLVPRSYFLRYLAAWMVFLGARSVKQAGKGVGRLPSDGSAGFLVLSVLEAVALFVFGYLALVGFLGSDWGLLVAAGAGVAAAFYSLTGDVDDGGVSGGNLS